MDKKRSPMQEAGRDSLVARKPFPDMPTCGVNFSEEGRRAGASPSYLYQSKDSKQTTYPIIQTTGDDRIDRRLG